MALPTQILTIKNKNDNLENARDKLNNMVNKIKNFRFDMDNLDYIAAGMVNGEKRYFKCNNYESSYDCPYECLKNEQPDIVVKFHVFKKVPTEFISLMKKYEPMGDDCPSYYDYRDNYSWNIVKCDKSKKRNKKIEFLQNN